MVENEQFQQDMARLNRDFLNFITKHLETNPSADLTPSLKSYMQNLDNLDEKYAGDSKENQRPIKKAILPINKSLQQLRKRFQLDPAAEALLQSPKTPVVTKNN